ncbi:MAG: DNA topoisomerase I [Nanoarchaeota archaeon]
MTYELIISEKPQAAAKIASALADSKVQKQREYDVNYFVFTHKGKNIIVASAVGHLYILGEKNGESWKYPVFETEWKPIYKVSKTANYTKNYIKLLTKLGKQADEITVASDFDIEGEVIGLNVVRFALGKKDANRMKFSTLTKDELIKAYTNKLKTLEWGQAKAGETRHNLDWYYGINISRILTDSIKKATNQFKVLSSGRVQGPSLHFLAQREKSILAFKPKTYWELFLNGLCKDIKIKAKYEEEKVFDEDKVKTILEKTKGKDGFIKSVEKKQSNQSAPTPFDLTSLQMEASNLFGISPKQTLEIAQKLYIAGVTSYPRTSSQKLSKELELKKILEKLKKQPPLKDKVELIYKINPSIKPNEGKKTDPAHPAIHPTGEIPSKLEGRDFKIYDLICKRFLAVFGKPAVRESNKIIVDVESYNFLLKGTRTVKKNWHELYEPYVKFEEIELPKLEKDMVVKNKKVESNKKETQPPRRYTDASIIKELEKRNIGTKATRAEILSNLRSRGYIIDKSIKVTNLGLKIDEVLAEEIPNIVDETLTRDFEEEMEKIRSNESSPKKVLDRAKENIVKIIDEVVSKQQSVGRKLAQASAIAQKELEVLGSCNKCDKGQIVIRVAKQSKKRFAACNNYPNCKNIFPLPQMGKIERTDNLCKDCNSPVIILLTPKKRPWRLCINPQCPSKNNTNNNYNKK